MSETEIGNGIDPLPPRDVFKVTAAGVAAWSAAFTRVEVLMAGHGCRILRIHKTGRRDIEIRLGQPEADHIAGLLRSEAAA